MQPYEHQIECANKAVELIKTYSIAYLAMQERTGKTLTALLAAKILKKESILVITKKKAIHGWLDTLSKWGGIEPACITVVNYHSVDKLTNINKPDLVILDEAHNYISTTPCHAKKVGKLWADVYKHIKLAPIIYISATPYSQGAYMLWGQFALSYYSPFKPYGGMNYHDFYNKFAERGYTPSLDGTKCVRAYGGVLKKTWDTLQDDKVLALCNHLFITMTREQIGFTHEPEDILHWIKLDKTREYYNHTRKHKILECKVVSYPGDIRNKDLEVDLQMDVYNHETKKKEKQDNISKRRACLHMLEGGTVKVDDVYYFLDYKPEKVQYIQDTFTNLDNTVIMYNFIAEEFLLKYYFPNSLILHATSYAEGVDLSNYQQLIIYSQDYSTARHIQRRCRQANLDRQQEIKVHYLLVEGAISSQVYKTVCENKKNFTDKLFEDKDI